MRVQVAQHPGRLHTLAEEEVGRVARKRRVRAHPLERAEEDRLEALAVGVVVVGLVGDVEVIHPRRKLRVLSNNARGELREVASVCMQLPSLVAMT